MATAPNYPRRINADGTIDIRCKICGEFICRTLYRGFSTSICHQCGGGDPLDPTWQDLRTPGLEPPREDDMSLYNLEALPVNVNPDERVGAIGYIFRALGFRGKKKDTERTKASRETAARKRRRPIFSGGSDGVEAPKKEDDE